jgi:hypothetical protein
MSIAPDDTTDTDPDFVTTPDGQPIEPEKVDAGVVVPTEQDED